MKQFLRIGLGTALLAALLACSPEQRASSTGQFFSGDKWDVDAVEALPDTKIAALPEPDQLYLREIRKRFLDLARAEMAEGDWDDGAFFLSIVRQALDGKRPEPSAPESRGLTGEQRQAQDKAFGQMQGWLSSAGSMLRAPEEIAAAQANYECWLQEAAEGHQVAEIEACQGQFGVLVIVIREKADLPKNMAVILPGDEGKPTGIELTQKGKTVTLDREFAAAGTGKKLGRLAVTEAEIRDAFADALKAKPKPPKEFVLTFASASTVISDQAFEHVLAAAEEARARPGAEVIVTGFSDAVGDAAYNKRLSQLRAEAVKEAVTNELRDKEDVAFSVDGQGEEGLADEDDRDAEANRRVVILVR